MQISDRLQLVVDFVDSCESMADIGTDHGYVPITLVKSGKVNKAYAMDVNKGPLKRAREHIEAEGLSQQIETRLSDGMEQLKENEAETVVIAGMGGELMVRILKQKEQVLQTVKTLVLSPHSEMFLVREFLWNNHYRIVREEMIQDAGKFYTVMKAEKVTEAEPVYQQYEYMYGRLLIKEKSSVLKDYLHDKKNKLSLIYKGLEGQSSEVSKNRKQEIELELKEIELVLTLIEEK